MVIAQTVGIGGIVADTQKRCPLTLKDADPVTGGNPQASGIIFDKVIDRIAAQAGAIRRIMLITGEVILLPVVAIESIARSGKPQGAAVVFQHQVDVITTQAVGISRIMPVTDKAVLFPVIAIHALPGTDEP